MVLFFLNPIKSQELIKNGDFEEFKRDSRFFLFNALKHWYKPTWASSDYQTIDNHWKHQFLQPKFGKSYIGLVIGSNYDYAEYGTTKLKQILKEDSLYCVSMYVALSEISTIAPFGVDILFTKKRVSIFTRKHIAYKYKPDIIGLGNHYITNRKNWIKISSVYKAKGNEKYLTFGKFYDNNYFEFKELIDSKKTYHGYLYIDNVSLTPIQDSTLCDCNIKRIELSEIYKDTIMGENNEIKDSVIFKEGSRIELRNLFFETDSYELKEESEDELNSLYELLNKYPGISIQINGYTDNTGSEKRNLYLSENRAKAVVDYLKEKGIREERLKYKGYGSDNPIATNETEEGRAKNRRVEFVVIKEEE